MTAIADIFRSFQDEYYTRYGDRLLPSHKKTIEDIIRCRTPAMGGQLYVCAGCHSYEYAYHSCNNRHCPQCQNEYTTDWIEEQKQRLLPVPYFFATFTIPEELNRIARSSQNMFYSMLFRASASALSTLAGDKRFLGARLGMMGALHTWTRDMRYHPHVHYIVPGGGISFNGKQWSTPKNNQFLVHVKPLSRLFRSTFKHELKKTPLYQAVPPEVWNKEWVVHIQPAGLSVVLPTYLYICGSYFGQRQGVRSAAYPLWYASERATQTVDKRTPPCGKALFGRLLRHSFSTYRRGYAIVVVP